MSSDTNVEAIIARHFNARAALGEQATNDVAEDRKFVDAVGRGIALLEAFGRRSGSLSNADLHEITGFSKPAITRLAHTLVTLGYLRRVENGRFKLTPKIAALARPMLEAGAATLPSDALAAIAASGPWCIVVAEPNGASLIVTASFRGTAPGTPECAIGTTLDLATTSAGRAWIATLDAQARQQALLSLDLESHALEVFATARAKLLSDGYCVEVGEWRRGLATLAMPFDADGRAGGRVVMCATPEKRAWRERLVRDVVPKLRKTLPFSVPAR